MNENENENEKEEKGALACLSSLDCDAVGFSAGDLSFADFPARLSAHRGQAATIHQKRHFSAEHSTSRPAQSGINSRWPLLSHDHRHI